MYGNLAIMPLRSAYDFGSKLVKKVNKIYEEEKSLYRCQHINCEEVTFANGEVKTVITESVRGKDLYIVQLCDDPYTEASINDNIMKLATAVNAAWYGDAQRITVVIPQYPYARQDKKKGREAVTARIFGNLLKSSGADKILTLDLHSEAIEGFFDDLRLENMHAGHLIMNHIRNHYPISNLCVVAPDVGSAKRGLFFAKRFDCDLAIIEKVRDYSRTSTVKGMTLVGNVEGKDILINDDMLATGGTLLRACGLLKEEGAKRIYISVSLPFFSGKAYEKFDEAYKQGLFEEIIGTDAMPWDDQFKKNHPWYTEITVAPLFAHVIYAMAHGKSVSRFLE